MLINRLKEFREREGLTQVELARKARMASQNLSAIENGRLSAWPKIRKALARALRTKVEEIFPPEGYDTGKAGEMEGMRKVVEWVEKNKAHLQDPSDPDFDARTSIPCVILKEDDWQNFIKEQGLK